MYYIYKVHEVNVAIEIKPDPVTIKANDIVCWIFRGLRTYDVAEVQKIDQLTTEELDSKSITPRYIYLSGSNVCHLGV